MLKEKAWKYFCQLSHGIVMFLVGSAILVPIFLFPPTGLLIIPVGFIGLIAASLVLHGIIKGPMSLLKLLGVGLTAMFRDSSLPVTQPNNETETTLLLGAGQRSGTVNDSRPPFQPAAGTLFSSKPSYSEKEDVSVAFSLDQPH